MSSTQSTGEAPAPSEDVLATREIIQRWPKTARELLEARYASFEAGDVDFILATHHPETREQVDRDAVKNWATKSQWKGLSIDSIEEKKSGESVAIRFSVKYQRGVETITHSENAEFRKYQDRWYYYDSEFPKPETLRREGEKIGRNDPCSCGSGKKFKKCHGA